VNEIFWIKGKAGEAAPHLAIVLRPRGNNCLEDDLRGLRQGGIQTIVSLLEPDEAEWVGLKDEQGTAMRAGLSFLSYPIPDAQVPEDVLSFRQFINGIADRVAARETVGVHCRGCIGRATVTAACSLIHLGWNPATALAAIQRARGVSVPDTPEQKAWILAYKAQP
jgi:protein-tyrosine phosphatase